MENSLLHSSSSENNGSKIDSKASATADQAGPGNTSPDVTDSSSNRSRRHSSSLSAIVGHIGTKIKRSSSTVSSSSDGRISSLQKSAQSGSLSTPPKRKNSSSTSDINSENYTPKAPSRRRSTPINQRTATEASLPSTKNNKKTSLRGIFSSTRKISLQSDLFGNDQLPPRPSLFIKELNKESKTVVNELSNDKRLNNGDQESVRKIGNGTKNSFNNVSNAPSDRRTRAHKHSLQQGNKWKLLQQKVLGNLDEEKDDYDEDVENKQYNGKVLKSKYENYFLKR